MLIYVGFIGQLIDLRGAKGVNANTTPEEIIDRIKDVLRLEFGSDHNTDIAIMLTESATVIKHD